MAEPGRSQAEVARELVKSTTVSGGAVEGLEGGEIVPKKDPKPAASVDGEEEGGGGEGGTLGPAEENTIDNVGNVSASDAAAITKMQAQVRGRAVRKENESQNKAASALQAQIRGRVARKELEEQKQAAQVMQSRARGMLTRKSMKQDGDATTKRKASLARAAEKHSPRVDEAGHDQVSPRTALANAIMMDVELQESKSREAPELSEAQNETVGADSHAAGNSSELPDLGDIDEGAVLKIQSRTRGMLGRQAAQRHADTKQAEDYEESVVKIQSRARGHLARQVQNKRDRHEEGKHSRSARSALLDGIDENNIVKIQSRTRGMLARKEAQKRHDDAALLDGIDESRVTKIQSRARGMLARKDVKTLHNNAALLEGIDEGSVTKIQSRTRGMLARKNKAGRGASGSNEALYREAEEHFGGASSDVNAGVDTQNLNPDEVFAAKDALAKRRIKQEAAARRRLKEEARLRRERMNDELRARHERDIELFRGADGDMDGGQSAGLPPVSHPSAPAGKPSNRANYIKRPANLKKINMADIGKLDPEDERQRLGLPPSPRGVPGGQSFSRMNSMKSPAALRSRDEMDVMGGDPRSAQRPHLPSLMPQDDPYAQQPLIPRRKVKKPLYKRLEESYKRQEQEVERKKNLAYQKRKLQKHAHAPSREEIAEHRARVDALTREREDLKRRRKYNRDTDRDNRARYEPVVARVRQPTIREQYLSEGDPHQYSPTNEKGGGSTASNTTFRRQIKKEMEEKKTAKQRELDKRREKMERARMYGEKVRRAAPGTDNELEDGGDMQLSSQSYASPAGRVGGGARRQPSDNNGYYEDNRDENYSDDGAVGGRKDYYQLLAEKEARTERVRTLKAKGPRRRPGAGRPPLEPLSGADRRDIADAAEERAVGGRMNMLDVPDSGDQYRSPGSIRRGRELNRTQNQLMKPPVGRSMKQGDTSVDNRTAAVMPKVSKWVASLMNSDGNEESLAKIYETGFQMLMAEKGISF